MAILDAALQTHKDERRPLRVGPIARGVDRLRADWDPLVSA